MTVPPAVDERITGEPLSAFLGTATDDRPHVAPVWYLSYDGYIWFFTGGRKLANLESNPRVAVAIEKRGADGWLVTLRGTATTVADEATRDDIADRLFVQYLGNPDAETFRAETGEPTGTLVRVDVGSADVREQ
jgi:nitroimidazol reductase NimA-like FMN-containing flavoprotein (pyridoxamine 5'-phosphate oxidase superfamily)